MTRRTIPDTHVSRRAALAGAGAAAVSACAHRGPPPALGAAAPVAHGVASGDPLQDRVVIWTRVTPAAGPVEVAWTMARDRDLADVVASGAALTDAARDFTVKVDVAGLEPGRAYHYGFAVGGARSPVARTRTLPAGPVDSFTLAVASCANFPAGWFHVYRHIAARGDADLVVFLGDYIYEYGPGGFATGWGMRRGRAPDPPHETVTLADYRARHAQYKTDPDLQAAHAVLPWIAIWDDHETADDSDRDGAGNHDPSEGDWSARKRASLQSYFEWMPVREPAPGRAREALWRTFEIGDLATLQMLETRLSARSPGLTWDDAGLPRDADPNDPDDLASMTDFVNDVVGDPGRDLLGPAQLADVAASLRASAAAGKPWTLLGNQVVMARTVSPDFTRTLPFWVRWLAKLQRREARQALNLSRFGVPMNLDQWDGYPAERERLYAAARDAGAQLITLTGDSHMFFVNDLVAADGTRMGVELGATSVSSPSPFNLVKVPGVDVASQVEEANVEVRHLSGLDRGYIALTLTPERAVAELRTIDTVTRRAHAAGVDSVWEIVKDADGALTATRLDRAQARAT